MIDEDRIREMPVSVIREEVRIWSRILAGHVNFELFGFCKYVNTDCKQCPIFSDVCDNMFGLGIEMNMEEWRQYISDYIKVLKPYCKFEDE